MREAPLTRWRAVLAVRQLAADFVGFSGPRRSVVAGLLISAGALAEGISLALIVPLVATISYPGAQRWRNVFQPLCDGFNLCTATQRLPALLALFIAAFTLRAMALAWRDRVISGLEAEFVEYRRIALVRALAGSAWENLAALKHSRITYLLAAEIQQLATAVRQLATLATSLVMLASQWLLLAFLAPPMALLFALAATIAVVAEIPALRRSGVRARNSRRGQAAIIALAQQLLGGLKQALAQNLQHAFVAEIEQASGEILRQNRDYERRAARGRIAGSVGAAMAISAMALVGTRSGIPPARLVAGITVFIRMMGPGMAALRSLKMLVQSLPAHDELLAMETELTRNAEPAPEANGCAAAPTGDIVLRDVCFGHSGGGVRFEQLCLTLEQGSLIGVSGPSGAGKTTFVDMLAGLIAPQEGSVTVGGKALSGATLSAWQRRIAYVAQDNYLFNDTLRRNLTWGLEGIAEDHIDEALAATESVDVIAALQLGLEQPVGERGLRLSGGERQRLALARALIRRPALLVLDEATNALDMATEARILMRLSQLDWHPTVIIIAHRPEALVHCTRILRFERGALIES